MQSMYVCVWPVFRWLTDVRVADCVRGARAGGGAFAPLTRSCPELPPCLRAGAGAFGWAGDAALRSFTLAAAHGTSRDVPRAARPTSNERVNEARRAPGFCVLVLSEAVKGHTEFYCRAHSRARFRVRV